MQNECPVNLCLKPTYTDEFQAILDIVSGAMKQVKNKKGVDLEELAMEIAILIADKRKIDIYKT